VRNNLKLEKSEYGAKSLFISVIQLKRWN